MDKPGRERNTKTMHFYRASLLLVALLSLTSSQPSSAENMHDALASALRGTQASAVILDMNTGAVTAHVGLDRRATPGSTLKPLLLEYALEHGIVSAQSQVLCHRNLHIGARSLPCTHPASQDVFTAETALAESCNTYFADLGRRYSGAALDHALQQYKLPRASLVNADADGRALTVLGLQNVSVSSRGLARAYRQLAMAMPSEGPVAKGLAGSVAYGMADPASIPSLAILGKTGTASNPGEAWTHGWFAGILPEKLVLVIFLPHGDGGTAARLAKTFFLHMQQTKTSP